MIQETKKIEGAQRQKFHTDDEKSVRNPAMYPTS